MFPFIFFITWFPAFTYLAKGDYEYLIISCCGMATFFLWLIALIYDLRERREGEKP
jgi:hypothetical protein